jgi:hypothetical protein
VRAKTCRFNARGVFANGRRVCWSCGTHGVLRGTNDAARPPAGGAAAATDALRLTQTARPGQRLGPLRAAHQRDEARYLAMVVAEVLARDG